MDIIKGRKDCSHGIFARLSMMLHCNKLGDLLVQKGQLTVEGLQFALVCQRRGQTRLGCILIQHNLVSRRLLYSTLVQQWSLRFVAAAVTFTISCSSFGARSARAAGIEDVPGELSLVAAADSYAPARAIPALFGSTEQESSNITPFTKWSAMFARFAEESHQAAGRGAIQRLQAQLQPAAGYTTERKAEFVNALMNAKPYIEDIHNWGVSDYWETPVEFMAKGGDCEDYAIAKYASMRMLGVPDSQLRLAIVKDLERGIPHAVLIVYTDAGNALVLDNQTGAVRNAAAVSRYQPIYSINRTAWWLHKASNATLLASAQ